MNANSKTYEQSAPPSIALAMMAWHLAWRRCFLGQVSAIGEPMDRGDDAGLYPASAEHYRIIDRLSRAEQP